nr:hypothetical protein [Tanacetum cinerariifolium]
MIKPMLRVKRKSSTKPLKMYCLVVTDDYSRFTWVFFLATKDETIGILKSFITRIENLVGQKVKVIRCDNETEFKNREMNQFCEIKEAVNTACYVQNRVCHVTILNTTDHLGKFDGKADEGFFVRYFLNSKAFRVFNSRTMIVEENLHIRFSKSTPNVVGSGPDWLFDINALTRTMNYEPIVAGTQLMVLQTADLPFSQDPKSSHDDRSRSLSNDGKKVDEDLRNENKCKDQENGDNVNKTNNVNTVSSTVNAVITNEIPFNPNIPALEDVKIFNFLNDDEDDGSMADINNLDTTMYQMDVKSVFLYEKIEEEVYVCQPPGFEDLDFPNRVYKVEKALTASTPLETQKPLLKDEDGEEVDVYMYRSMIGSLMYLNSSRPDIIFAVCACARYQVNLKVSHLYAVKKIFRKICQVFNVAGEELNAAKQKLMLLDSAAEAS